ncbi:MAG: hypothetical protein HZB87_06985 [Desulfatitalea sp.]|nr:hypothetical protein [Desulfatitalea sp.]
MKPKDAAFVPDALGLVERAVHLLRKEGGALADYYIGTLPFILALLFFWSDMSRNPYAELYCAPAAGGLALLFVWMKLWHAVARGRRDHAAHGLVLCFLSKRQRPGCPRDRQH